MKKNQNKINFLVLIGITILVLFFSLKDDFNSILKEILTINYWWLILAFLMVIAYWLLRSKSINIFTRKLKKDTKYFSSLQLMLRTQFFNAVTPFATGGQPYQVYYLVKNGISVSASTSIIIQNFIVYQIAMVLLGISAIIANQAFSLFAKNMILRRLVTLGFVINTSVIIILFLVAFDKKINKKLIKLGISILSKLKIIKDKEKKQAEWDEYINKFHNSAKTLLENKWDFVKTIIYNLLALSMLYSIPVVLLYATGDFNSFNILLAIVTSSYVMLLGSFVPIPGGTGGLEYGFITFYGNFLTGSKLTAIMLLWRFVTYYFGMIVGAISLNMKKVK